MESLIYLDTHVVVWLYAGETGLFEPSALDAIENHDLLISPIVELELQYLFETKRITVPAAEIINNLTVAIGLQKCTHNFSDVIVKAIQMNWTRDPFDRLIVGQAAIHESPLCTKDRFILKNYKQAFWASFS